MALSDRPCRRSFAHGQDSGLLLGHLDQLAGRSDGEAEPDRAAEMPASRALVVLLVGDPLANGAPGRTRTSTPLRATDVESAAAARAKPLMRTRK
jgi:hypothetical protein